MLTINFNKIKYLFESIISEQTAAEEKKIKEEKKRMLLRKLSFRPTVDELKEKKVSLKYSSYINCIRGF